MRHRLRTYAYLQLSQVAHRLADWPHRDRGSEAHRAAVRERDARLAKYRRLMDTLDERQADSEGRA